MSNISLGIIGGGQLGSMLTVAAKKFDIKVVVLLFFILVAIYAMYQESIKDEDCQCGN